MDLLTIILFEQISIIEKVYKPTIKDGNIFWIKYKNKISNDWN